MSAADPPVLPDYAPVPALGPALNEQGHSRPCRAKPLLGTDGPPSGC